MMKQINGIGLAGAALGLVLALALNPAHAQTTRSSLTPEDWLKMRSIRRPSSMEKGNR